MWRPVFMTVLLLSLCLGISYAASKTPPEIKTEIRADTPVTETHAFIIFNPASTTDSSTFDLPEGWEFLPQEMLYNPNDGRVVAMIKKKVTAEVPAPAP